MSHLTTEITPRRVLCNDRSFAAAVCNSTRLLLGESQLNNVSNCCDCPSKTKLTTDLLSKGRAQGYLGGQQM